MGSNIPSHDGNNHRNSRSVSVVPVFQCRFCGSIVATEAGADSHRDNCPLAPPLNGSMRMTTMVSIKFPCPLVLLEKVAYIPEPKFDSSGGGDVESESLGVNLNSLPRRKSGLKALQKLQMVVDSEAVFEDEDFDPKNCDLSEEDEKDDDDDTNAKSHKSMLIERGSQLMKRHALKRLLDEDEYKPSKINETKRNPKLKKVVSQNSKERIRVRAKVQTKPHEKGYYGLPCSNCPARFNSEDTLERHEYNVHGEGSKNRTIITCPICGWMFHYRLLFHNHVKGHETAEAVEESFDLWNGWPKHRNRLSKSCSPFSCRCKYCVIPLKTQEMFLDHMKRYHGDKGRFSKFSCVYCKSSEHDSMKLLIRHIQTAHVFEFYGTETKFDELANEDCKYCKKTVRRYYMKEHIRVMHADGKIQTEPKPENPFPCPFPECTAKLKQFAFLKSHFLYHLENNPYRCTFPNCRFRSDARCHLVRHMRMHIGQLGPCPKCDKRIPWVGQMKRHVGCKNDDSNEKAFTKKDFDEEIEKLNTEPKYLSSIIRKLMGKVNINSIFKSDPVFIRISEKNPEFKKQILLRGNKGRGRTGKVPEEKRLKCEKCPKTFETEKGLRTHVTEIHLPRPHKCPKCLRTYLTKAQLNGHIRSVHESKLPHNEFMIQLEDGRCECTKCGAEGSCVASMKRHWLLIHKIQLPSFKVRAKNVKRIKTKSKRIRRKRPSPFRKIPTKPPAENADGLNAVIKVEAGLEASETKPMVLPVQNSLVKTDLEECNTPVQAVAVKQERLETSGNDIVGHGDDDNDIISVKLEPQD